MNQDSGMLVSWVTLKDILFRTSMMLHSITCCWKHTISSCQISKRSGSPVDSGNAGAVIGKSGSSSIDDAAERGDADKLYARREECSSEVHSPGEALARKHPSLPEQP